ncbi:MAG TPA: AI-2E family transporter [Xanthobacteraceae bacterium]|nr:AI-2E family transporter [Xanthobacteraceae bacterium]
MSQNWDSRRIAHTVLIVAVVLLSVWMLWRFLPALAWACVLAIATWPLRQALANRGLSNTALAGVLTLVLAFLLVLPLIGLGFQAAHESGAIMQWLADVRQNGLGTPQWLSRLPLVGSSVAAWWQANLAEPGAAHALFGRAESSGVVSVTRSLGVQVANRLTILVFTLLTLFFLYRDGPSVMKEAQAIADRLFGPPGARLGKNAITAVRGTVNGLVLVGLAEGVLLGIAYLAAGLTHAALFGLLTAILATVPFGAPIVFIACALYLLAQAQTTAAIALLVFGVLVTFVADHFVRPLLIGNSTRLPFLWVLLGIFAGLETFGLVGLFLGPAVISILIAIWREGAE